MKKSVYVLLIVLWLVTACGTGESPTQTPIPPTATSSPSPTVKPTIALPSPTATPVPPTATPVPPTATPVPPTVTPMPPTPTATVLPPLSGSGGGVIAFVSSWDIYVMNADGTDVRQLTTHRSRDAWPTWSPDGKQIAFMSERNGRWDVFVMDVEEGEPSVRRLPSDYLNWEPAWSPDGAWIAFGSLRNGNSDIYVTGVHATGRDERRLTRHSNVDGYPCWSPDSTQIAFVSDRDGNWEIYVMNADGSDVRRLTNHDADDWDPDWSPDGSQIAIASGRDGNMEIYVVNADGSDLRRLTDHPADDMNPSWSPDGTRIAFHREEGGNAEIYLINADGSNLRKLMTGSDDGSNPVWRPDPTALPAYIPLYEPATCRFDKPSGYEIECGYLAVPEDRSQPDGRMVRMHVAIFRSRHSNPAPDPVVYLTGGGGVDTFDYLPWFLPAFGDAILLHRDLIFFNQRGMHRNEPQLSCPGLPELLQRLAAPGPNGQYIDRQEREAQQAAFFADCYTDLVAQGIKLEMYDSVTSAADANDLRIALGYDQVNYYGSSYGTLLGLLLMRDHPEGTRSVVLDSVFPPEASYLNEYGLNAYDTFRKLFDGCAADPQCSQQHPDLEAKLYQVVDHLNANPRTTTWNDVQEVMYDGGTFIDVIYIYLYIGEPELAIEAIEGASAGDFSMADDWAPGRMDLDSYHIQWGFYRNRDCREEAPFSSYEEYYALMEGLPPQLVEHYKPSLELGLCEGWEVEPAASIENEPVVSDVPALLVSGELDPITPPRWARGAAEHLSNSYFYVFPGYGHGVTRNSECALDIMLQFFNDPTKEPDTSCIDEEVEP